MNVKERLKMKKEIDSKTGLLINNARNLLERKKLQISDTGMRNILNVSSSASCTEEVLSFIRYQIGRGQLRRDEGENLISEIEKLRTIASDISTKVPSESEDKIMQTLVTLFLGYMNQEFKYLSKKREEKGGGRDEGD